jgi:hypothetical protein
MGDETKFWLGVNLVSWTAVVLLVWIISSYFKDLNGKVAEMVKQGVDPIAVSCALQDNYGNNPTCLVLASKGLLAQEVE